MDQYYYPLFYDPGALMVSALFPGSSGLGSSPGRGHCVVFLGKTLNFQIAYGKPIVAIFNNLIYIQFSIYIYVIFFLFIQFNIYIYLYLSIFV